MIPTCKDCRYQASIYFVGRLRYCVCHVKLTGYYRKKTNYSTWSVPLLAGQIVLLQNCVSSTNQSAGQGSCCSSFYLKLPPNKRLQLVAYNYSRNMLNVCADFLSSCRGNPNSMYRHNLSNTSFGNTHTHARTHARTHTHTRTHARTHDDTHTTTTTHTQ